MSLPRPVASAQYMKVFQDHHRDLGQPSGRLALYVLSETAEDDKCVKCPPGIATLINSNSNEKLFPERIHLRSSAFICG
jgi:hypothetical protein